MPDGEYEAIEEIHEANAMLETSRDGAGATSFRHSIIGFKMRRLDGRSILQSRINGFTDSRLRPYDQWESFRDEAKLAWASYRAATLPAVISRLAVRYINRIHLPNSLIELDDFFATTPSIAPELPQRFGGFFMQLQIPFDEVSGTAMINQTIVPPNTEDTVSVVLDIDLFRDHDVPQTEDSIWECLEQLHRAENRVFEASITEATRRLIEPLRVAWPSLIGQALKYADNSTS